MTDCHTSVLQCIWVTVKSVISQLHIHYSSGGELRSCMRTLNARLRLIAGVRTIISGFPEALSIDGGDTTAGRKQKKIILTLSGQLTLSTISVHCDKISSALTSFDKVTLDLSGGSNCDFAFVQLLVSAEKTALSRGKTLSIQAPANSCLRALLQSAGNPLQTFETIEVGT